MQWLRRVTRCWLVAVKVLLTLQKVNWGLALLCTRLGDIMPLQLKWQIDPLSLWQVCPKTGAKAGYSCHTDQKGSIESWTSMGSKESQ